MPRRKSNTSEPSPPDDIEMERPGPLPPRRPLTVAAFNGLVIPEASPLAAALRMQTLGFPVFPLLPNGLPAFANFQNLATLSSLQIAAWMTQDSPVGNIRTATGYGILTGRPLPGGGFLIVWDLDVKHGRPGFESWMALGQDFPCDTRAVVTRSGGIHYYFAAPLEFSQRIDLRPGIDIRCHANYVIGPNSIVFDQHGAPGHYALINDCPPAPLPVELAQLLTPSRAPKDKTAATTPPPGYAEYEDDAAARGRALGVLRGSALERGRAYEVCCAVRDCAISEGLCLELVDEHWNARLDVPISDESLEAIVTNAYKHAQRPPGSRHPRSDFSHVVIEPPPPPPGGASAPPPPPPGDDGADAEAGADGAGTKAPGGGVPPPPGTNEWWQKDDGPPTPLDWDEMLRVGAREWLYGTSLIRGYVSALGARGAVGKTSVIIPTALSVAMDRPLLDEPVYEQVIVWLWTLEDKKDELLLRVRAACQHYRIKREDLEGRLSLDSGRDYAMVLARNEAGTLKINWELAHRLIAKLQANKIGLLVLDPFIKTHGVDESDNNAIDQIVTVWSYIADKANCAILLAHHFRKNGVGGDPDSFRGASSFLDACRAGETLARMSLEEATALGIDPALAWSYLKAESAKPNMAPPPELATWYHLLSVELPGTARGRRPNEKVGTAVRWYPPAPLADVSSLRELEMLDTIASAVGLPEGELFTHDKKSKARWAGHVVIKATAAIGTAKTPIEASAIIKEWIRSGKLTKGTYASPGRNNEQRTCVTVNSAKLEQFRKDVEHMQAHK